MSKRIARLKEYYKSILGDKFNENDYNFVEGNFVFRKEITGKTEVNLLEEDSGEVESVKNTLSQEELTVKWLMKDWGFKQMLYENIMPNARNIEAFISVKEPFTKRGKKPGDIDLLLINTDNINSVALECKIVKSEYSREESTKINKVNSIQNKGVSQINAYTKLGFSKSYLLIIIIDDGRLKNNLNVLFRSTADDAIREIFKNPWMEDLDENVGVAYTIISQFNQKNINETFGIRFKVVKEAAARKQDEELNLKIKSLL